MTSKLQIIFARFSLMILILFGYFSAQSQITYGSSNFASVNDSFIVSKVSALSLLNADFSDTDSATTWDYSNLTPLSQRIVQFKAPSTTGFSVAYLLACNLNCFNSCYADCIGNGGFAPICQGACSFDCSITCLQNWGNFNLAELVNDSISLGIISLTDVYNLYNKSNNSLIQNALGIKISNIPLVVEYNQPDVIYSFPLQYQGTSTSHSSYQISLDSIPGTGINFGFTYKHAQTRTNFIEGWGELTTPYQTYSSTLKLKSIIANKDSVTVLGNTITLSDFLPSQFTPDTIIEYKWFDSNTGIPVLSAKAWLINGTEIHQEVEFTDTVRCFNPFPLFGYLPIPAILTNASDSVEVNFYSQSFNVDSFYWEFDDPMSSSNISNSANPSHFYTEAGVYNVTLTSCNTACPTHWCEDITLPVFVIDQRTDSVLSIPTVLTDVDVNIYPNPFYDELTIDWAEASGNTYTLDLIDLTGRIVFSKKGSSIDKSINFKTTELLGSVYLLRLTLDNNTYFKKVYKTN